MPQARKKADMTVKLSGWTKLVSVCNGLDLNRFSKVHVFKVYP